MVQPKVKFNNSAVAETEAAFDWYYERSPSAANVFLEELSRSISRICEDPKRWPKYDKTCRRYIFPRFPFQIIYRFKDNTVEVVAVAHGRRRPNYWVDQDKK